MKHVVTSEWLKARLGEPNVVVADCRFVMGQPDAGRGSYEEEHIAGAVYFDLERDLSDPVTEHGGRHPLPSVETLAALFGVRGINGESTVVAYDDQGGAMASRLWWILTYLGHDNVYVLDEGLAGWKRQAGPVASGIETLPSANFTARPRPDLLVGVEQVRAKLGHPGTVLIDSREAPRYRGEVEPIDKVAGHIPGAVNKFWKGVLEESGRFKDEGALVEYFADLHSDKELIVYCGSGVTATPNVLALSEAGFENVRLYSGSWSDWISYAGNPIATGGEEKLNKA